DPGAAVQVRLEHRDHPAAARPLGPGVQGGAGRLQVRGDLGGVVGVAVVDGDAGRLALELEAAGRPGEVAEAADRDLRVVAELVGDRDRRGRVQHVVPAGHGQGALQRVAAGRGEGEPGGEPVRGDAGYPELRVGRLAVG